MLLTIINITIKLQAEIEHIYPLWNMKYEDLVPEGNGNWLISTTLPTAKEGPYFLIMQSSESILLSEVVHINNQTATEKTRTVYLC